MRTGMKQDDASFGHLLKILHHVIKVQIRAVGVVVSILVNCEARVGKDGIVVAPSRIGKINVLMSVSLHEFSKHAKAPSSR